MVKIAGSKMTKLRYFFKNLPILRSKIAMAISASILQDITQESRTYNGKERTLSNS